MSIYLISRFSFLTTTIPLGLVRWGELVRKVKNNGVLGNRNQSESIDSRTDRLEGGQEVPLLRRERWFASLALLVTLGCTFALAGGSS